MRDVSSFLIYQKLVCCLLRTLSQCMGIYWSQCMGIYGQQPQLCWQSSFPGGEWHSSTSAGSRTWTWRTQGQTPQSWVGNWTVSLPKLHPKAWPSEDSSTWKRTGLRSHDFIVMRNWSGLFVREFEIRNLTWVMLVMSNMDPQLALPKKYIGRKTGI